MKVYNQVDKPLFVLPKSKAHSFIITDSNYLSVWLYFVFITSVVLTNVIKGTTVSFIMAYTAILVPSLTHSPLAYDFYKKIFFFSIIYFVLCSLTAFSVLLIEKMPSARDLILVSSEQGFFLRSSLFTQSLYLIPSFSLFVYVTYYYEKAHDRHLKAALSIFILYGFYKVLCYALFHINGDFLSNRMFGDGILNPAQFQLIIVAGYEINRFVSLTGEPSMYVFAIFPFFVYFIYKKGQTKFALLILSSLVLTFSGTFALGIGLFVVLHFVLVERNLKRAGLSVLALLIFLLLIPGEYRSAIINEVLVDKVNQQSVSGIERSQNFYDQMVFFEQLPILNKLLGVGFGTVRSTDFFSTVLVNSGIAGFLCFTGLFTYPIAKLPKSENPLRISLIITYIILMISVSEFSYPSMWLLLGIAYNSVIKGSLKQAAL